MYLYVSYNTELRNEGTSFALQAARPSRGPDNHVKWRSLLQVGKWK